MNSNTMEEDIPMVTSSSNIPIDQQQPAAGGEEFHNVLEIVTNANREVSQNNNVAAAQQIYQCALLDWVDDARELSDGSEEKEKLRRKIAELWIAFADMNKSAKMFKSAMEVYEQAVNCEIAGSVAQLWLVFARFQQERNRNKTAQKIYLRALVGDESRPAVIVNDESSSMLLWNDFLNMMREVNQTPDLTLEQLQNAVQTEHTAHITNPTKNLLYGNNHIDNSSLDLNPAKRVKLQDNNEGIINRVGTVIGSSTGNASNNSMTGEQISVDDTNATTVAAVITAKDIENASMALMALTKSLPPEISAAWFARDGDSPPFRPEPPLFSPSPPKLVDASGKDLLGTDMALKLTKKLLKQTDDDNSGTLLLDICKACWLMTALKENEATKGLSVLDEQLIADKEKFEADLDARLSVAGPARAAVEQMNAKEKSEFLAACNDKRQKLINIISWDFRQLLAVQQQLLTSAGMPGFDGVTVDASSIALQSNICSFMQSCFYLRARIGEKAHIAMLKSQKEKLLANKSIPPPPPPPPRKIMPMPPPQFPVAFPPPPNYSLPPPLPPPHHHFPPQQQQQQQQYSQQPNPNIYGTQAFPPGPPMPILNQPPPPMMNIPGQNGQLVPPSNQNNTFNPIQGQPQQQNRYHT